MKFCVAAAALSDIPGGHYLIIALAALTLLCVELCPLQVLAKELLVESNGMCEYAAHILGKVSITTWSGYCARCVMSMRLCAPQG